MQINHRRVFELSKWLDGLARKRKTSFKSLKYSAIPKNGGVYVISEFGGPKEAVLYIGQTKNLRERVYRNHWQGNLQASNFKKLLVRHKKARDKGDAKEYLKKNCSVRWVVVEDKKERLAREHYATAVLNPQFKSRKPKET